MSVTELTRKFDAYIHPDQPVWHGKYVMVVPEVSKAGAGGSGETPDLESALGWISVMGRIGQSVPMRDFLWLP
jgi:hypothetical protein